MEQCDVYGGGDTESAAEFPLSLAIGTGVVLLLYIACNFVYLSVLPLAGSADAATVAGRGIQFAAQDRVATAVMEADFCRYRREADGGGDPDVHVWLCERHPSCGGSGLLRDEPGRILL